MKKHLIKVIFLVGLNLLLVGMFFASMLEVKRRKEERNLFNLMTRSTHFNLQYMVSEKRSRETLQQTALRLL